MSDYDIKNSEEFHILQSKVDSFFVDDKVVCPYHLPYTATFHQAMFGPLNERIVELFLSAGYRRNGNSFYNMRCDECSACVSIRLQPEEFTPNRNQKRVLKKNQDITVSITDIKVNRERLDLCESFLNSRYPQKKNTSWGYYSCFFINKVCTTYEIEYRLNEQLIGVGIIDLGVNWMNAVYFYFDSKMADRSLGTFNILTMIDLCKQKQIAHLYLGYTIKQVAAMNYKERFFPHYILKNDKWQKVEKNSE